MTNVVAMKKTEKSNESEYPLAHTRATRMFSDGLDRIEREQGVSQRTLAKQLHYRSSVVISHMASGRAPIPIDRTMDFVRALKLDPTEFLWAVLEQRYPDIPFSRFCKGDKTKGAKASAVGNHDEEIMVMEDLQSAARGPLANLPPEQFSVMREAASDREARRRWLSTPELSVMDVFRAERPEILENGMTVKQRVKLKECVESL